MLFRSRCRRVAEDCASLGTSGAFATALLDQALRQAQEALAARDVSLIEAALTRLRGWRDVMPDAPTKRALPAPGARRSPSRTPQTPPWVMPREQFFTWKRAA